MIRRLTAFALVMSLLAPLHAQRPAEAVRQERERAVREAPQLVDVLGLKAGATVADVGAGGGATSVALAKLLGPGGRVYATDIGAAQIAEIKELVEKELPRMSSCWRGNRTGKFSDAVEWLPTPSYYVVEKTYLVGVLFWRTDCSQAPQRR